MKRINFSGIFCAAAYGQEAEQAAKAASLKNEGIERAKARYASLKAAEESKRARKAAKRQVASAASPQEECLLKANSTVYRTVAAYERRRLWLEAKPLVKMALARANKMASAQLGDAIIGAVKHQMTSHSWDDNWNFGQLRSAIWDLRQDLIDGAQEEKNPVVRHAMWWAEKYLKLNYRTSGDIRALLREVNFHE